MEASSFAVLASTRRVDRRKGAHERLQGIRASADGIRGIHQVFRAQEQAPHGMHQEHADTKLLIPAKAEIHLELLKKKAASLRLSVQR